MLLQGSENAVVTAFCDVVLSINPPKCPRGSGLPVAPPYTQSACPHCGVPLDGGVEVPQRVELGAL